MRLAEIRFEGQNKARGMQHETNRPTADSCYGRVDGAACVVGGPAGAVSRPQRPAANAAVTAGYEGERAVLCAAGLPGLERLRTGDQAYLQRLRSEKSCRIHRSCRSR